MSSDKRHVLAGVPRGPGRALDLGGGRGELRVPLQERGYSYVNVDFAPSGPGRKVQGDAHRLPFADAGFDLVVSSDTLEHFSDPIAVVREVRRVLADDGRFVVWVPFMHPFHGDDLYRYTPLGLEHVMSSAGLRIESLEAPLWVFSVMAQAVVVLLRRIGLGSLERRVERAAAWLDARLQRFGGGSKGFAQAYLVVAVPA